jgi:DNA-binding transcriptional MerR regulator
MTDDTTRGDATTRTPRSAGAGGSTRSSARTAVVDEDVDLGLPDRKYFKIGEVATLLSVEPHVLRYWETQFPQLKPYKARSGHRLYRRRDVETLLVIKDLLHVQRFTIAGARLALRQQGTTSLLPRAAEQLTLPPSPSLLARHTRVLESTIPTSVDDDGAASQRPTNAPPGAFVDADAVDDDDEDDVEFHLADPIRKAPEAPVDETEIEIVAVDGADLEDAMARQLAQQGHRGSIAPVEVRAKIPGQRGAALVALRTAKAELEALLAVLTSTASSSATSSSSSSSSSGRSTTTPTRRRLANS